MKFSIFVPMFQTCDPRGGASFDPRGILWTNLVEVHKETPHTKYQISTPSSFREEKKLKMGFFVPMFQLVTPGNGPVLTPGALYEQTW